ncbi:MAG: ABC transporter permease subunit [Gemmatimonadota bacterium]|nr:ABC transporter permease subunit [Gemmatimonadota bacterium]
MPDLSRLLAMARKEWIQLRRDPRSMALAFVLPVFLLLFFGYAITWDVDDIPLAVLDQDRTAESRALTDAFVSSGYFTVTGYLGASAEVDATLVGGGARGVLTIPPRFQSDLTGGRGATVQLLLDGSDANTATIAQNYADAIVWRHALAAGAGRSGRGPAMRLEARIWYNPDLESRHMIVPGLIAVIMSIIAAMLTALTIAREWERGTMEQLASTPVRRTEVILGKLLPYVGIGLFDVLVTVLAGMFIFGTPLNGSPFLLAAMTVLFLVGALGLGIFISAAVKSQVLATQIAMVATYLPAVLLSGFLFDIASMPRFLRGVTYLIPARYFVTVTRAIFLKGVGIGVLWPQALFMLAYAALGLGLAVRVFRKELSA